MARLNILLFGATGYTGQVTIPALHKLTKTEGTNLNWGIAGRSLEKLQNALTNAGKQLDTDLSHIPTIVADIKDEASLKRMTAQSQLLINVCGPYRFMGEPIVKACLNNSTHYIDISGEPQFMEMIQLKYSEEAQRRKVYIISSCGFDSIPVDLGVIFLQQKFPGILDSIEAHMVHTSDSQTSPKGPSFNYATWVAAVHGFSDYKSLRMIRKELNEKRTKVLPQGKTNNKKGIFKNDVTGKWSLPFLGADPSVVKRSQQYFYEHEGKLPIKFDLYFNVESVTSIIGGIFTYASLTMLTQSNFGKYLLLKHPKFFSFGVLQKRTPIEEERKQSRVSIYMKGNGTLEKANSEGHGNVSKNEIYSRISAQDAAYGNTGVIVSLAAITLLDEFDKLPNKGNGGVYTPAAAFSKTSLIKRLNSNGITFKIVSKY